MATFLLIFGGIVVAVIAKWSWHLLVLKFHEGWDKPKFIGHFQTVPSNVSGAVYDYFKKQTIWKSFEPKPSDRLVDIYRTVGDDVVDSFGAILEDLGVEIPPNGTLAEWITPVETLEDFVHWVDSARTIEAHGV